MRDSAQLAIVDYPVDITIRFRIRTDLQFTESLFGTVPVFGVAEINAQPVQSNHVDGPAGLDEGIDRARELVLATVGGLDEVAYRKIADVNV